MTPYRSSEQFQCFHFKRIGYTNTVGQSNRVKRPPLNATAILTFVGSTRYTADLVVKFHELPCPAYVLACLFDTNLPKLAPRVLEAMRKRKTNRKAREHHNDHIQPSFCLLALEKEHFFMSISFFNGVCVLSQGNVKVKSALPA